MKLLITHISLGLLLISSLIYNNIFHPKSILVALIISIFCLLHLHKIKIKNAYIEFIIIFYAILSSISLLTSKIKNVGWDEISLEISCLIILLLISRVKVPLNKLAMFIGGIISIQSLISIYQLTQNNEGRSAGTFLSLYEKANYFPNALGLFYILSFPLIFYIKSNLLRYGLLLLSGLGILLTLSRGALLVFVIQTVAILIFEFLQNKKQPLKTITCLLISIIIFSCFVQIRNYTQNNEINLKEKYTFNNTEKHTSINERAVFIKDSITSIANPNSKHWGPNTFSYIYPTIQEIWHVNAPHPHNMFLKISLERGVLTGLILALIIISAIALNFKDNFNKNNFYIFIALTGGILHNQIDYNLNFTTNLILFYILIGILIHNKSIKKNNFTQSKSVNAILIILLIIPGFWLYNQSLQTVSNYLVSKSQKENAIKILELNNDNKILLSNLYLELNKKDLALETLNKELKLNPYNDLAIFKIGEIKNNIESSKYFKKALEINDKNNFSYHYHYFKSLNQYNPQEFKSKQKEALKTLEEYLPFAENNIHYTAQNGNIDYAIKLCNLYQNTNPKFKIYKEILQQAQKRFSSN